MNAQPLPTPLVSIVLPTYNRLPFLRAAVESVFAQTYRHWELIVADDGSDENTQAYLRTLLDQPRVRAIWLPHSGNPGLVRNAALRNARGEFVAFLDSDDFWLPHKLAVQIAAMRARPEIQWTYTALTRVDEAGRPLPDSGRFIPREGRIAKELLEWRACIAMPTVIATRRLLEACGGFDEHQGQHEDYELWIRLALRSDVAVIAERLACVRTHREHFSAFDIRGLHAKRRLIERMQTLIADPALRKTLLAELSRNSARLAVASAAERNGHAAWHFLADSFRYSWWRGAWWWGAVKTPLRYLLPDSWVTALRHAGR